MENYIFYIFALIILVIVFLLMKKVAGCIIKAFVLLIVAAILAFVYFNYFKVSETDNVTGQERTTNVVDYN